MGKPNVSFMRTFSYIRHVRTTKPGLSKLEDRCTKAVVLAYEGGPRPIGSTIRLAGRW